MSDSGWWLVCHSATWWYMLYTAPPPSPLTIGAMTTPGLGRLPIDYQARMCMYALTCITMSTSMGRFFLLTKGNGRRVDLSFLIGVFFLFFFCARLRVWCVCVFGHLGDGSIGNGKRWKTNTGNSSRHEPTHIHKKGCGLACHHHHACSVTNRASFGGVITARTRVTDAHTGCRQNPDHDTLK